jgi:hypothetical protein
MNGDRVMKTRVLGRTISVLVAMLFGLSQTYAFSGGKSASIDETLATKQAQSRDVTVEVSIPKSSPSRAKILCTIKVQNLGDQPVAVLDGHISPECVAVVTDRITGMKIPFMDRQIQTFGPPGLRRRAFPGRRLTLEKGAMKTWTINLDTMFPIDAGKYQLNLTVMFNSRDAQRNFSVTVEDFSFEIRQQ